MNRQQVKADIAEAIRQVSVSLAEEFECGERSGAVSLPDVIEILDRVANAISMRLPGYVEE